MSFSAVAHIISGVVANQREDTKPGIWLVEAETRTWSLALGDRCLPTCALKYPFRTQDVSGPIDLLPRLFLGGNPDAQFQLLRCGWHSDADIRGFFLELVTGSAHLTRILDPPSCTAHPRENLCTYSASGRSCWRQKQLRLSSGDRSVTSTSQSHFWGGLGGNVVMRWLVSLNASPSCVRKSLDPQGLSFAEKQVTSETESFWFLRMYMDFCGLHPCSLDVAFLCWPIRTRMIEGCHNSVPCLQDLPETLVRCENCN